MSTKRITPSSLRRIDNVLDQAEQVFLSRFRETANERLIGLENEYPLVSVSGDPPQYASIEKLFMRLATDGWSSNVDPDSGKVVSVVRDGDSATQSYGQDTITTEVGFCTLEIALAPRRSLPAAETALKAILTKVTQVLTEDDVIVLGYGVQPISPPDDSLVAPVGRYVILSQDGRQYAHEIDGYPFTLNASSQLHVEVSSSEAISAVNALNATAGLRAGILANSSVCRGKGSHVRANRELFYDWWWTHRKSQIGIPPAFSSVRHYIEYLFDFRGLLISRDGNYLALDSEKPFRSFAIGEYETVRTPSGKPYNIEYHAEDVYFQSGLAWFNSRLQPRFGTVEDRISCQQPPRDHLSSSALTLGLVEQHHELSELASSLTLDQWRDIRIICCNHGLKGQYPDVDLQDLARELVEISRRGLEKRGLCEEVYLDALFQHVEAMSCPADEAERLFAAGGVKALIEQFDIHHFCS